MSEKAKARETLCFSCKNLFHVTMERTDKRTVGGLFGGDPPFSSRCLVESDFCHYLPGWIVTKCTHFEAEKKGKAKA